MIIFGWNEGFITDNYIIKDKKLCRHCNNMVEWQIFKSSLWFTLIFLPIFPHKIRYLLACPICGYTFEQNKEQFFGLVRRVDSFPVKLLDAERKARNSVLDSLVSFGIYFFFLMNAITKSVRTLATHHDGKKTMNIFLWSWLSMHMSNTIAAVIIGAVPGMPSILPISFIVFWLLLSSWLFMFARRMENEILRRKIDYSFGVKDVILLFVLGIFILAGPFVFAYKMTIASNKLAEDYNKNGA